MCIQELDPRVDPRWRNLVARHPAASVFHSPEWLEALHRTYGYQPVALGTSSAGRELSGAILFCKVAGWMTDGRFVSLPFSDHCEPLTSGHDEMGRLLSAMEDRATAGHCRYFEIRPLASESVDQCRLAQAQSFCYHKLDLNPPLDDLFRRLHKDCIRRKIERARREELTCEEGRTEGILRKFYSLQIATRRRHNLPPQPFAWFRNLADCVREKLNIYVASRHGTPVAAMLTLQHRATLVYKYGCSDKASNNLGGMPFLFWQAIQDAKSQGLTEFDLGRSDWDNEGLIRFKDRLGATRGTLTYWRYPKAAAVSRETSGLRYARRVFSVLPEACLVAAGKLLYRHLG